LSIYRGFSFSNAGARKIRLRCSHQTFVVGHGFAAFVRRLAHTTSAGVALLMVFCRQGIHSQPLFQPGFFFIDNLAGITVATLFIGLPFLGDASRNSFAPVDAELERVARIDG